MPPSLASAAWNDLKTKFLDTTVILLESFCVEKTFYICRCLTRTSTPNENVQERKLYALSEENCKKLFLSKSILKYVKSF